MCNAIDVQRLNAANTKRGANKAQQKLCVCHCVQVFVNVYHF